MKAVYYHGNKRFDVGKCELRSPKHKEVRLEVAYCGICGTDLHIYRGHMDNRIKVPQVIGHEMSGTVVEIGAGVENFSVGDRVVVRPLISCGNCSACRSGHHHICQNLDFMGIDSTGAFQQSWTVPSETLHKLPLSVDLRIAAMVEPLAVACHDVRLSEVQPGERVVVIGGGPIGLLISLVARLKGAAVILAEINPFRIKLAEQLSLRAVNPYDQEVIEYVQTWTGGAGVDVVFEVSGSPSGVQLTTELCRTRGRIVVVAIFSEPQPVNLFRLFWSELKMIGVRVYESEDYEEAISFVASKKLPLEKLISSVRYLEELPDVFSSLQTTPEQMKVIIDCSACYAAV